MANQPLAVLALPPPMVVSSPLAVLPAPPPMVAKPLLARLCVPPPMVDMWPLAVLSDVEETIPFDAAELDKWWQAQKKDGGEAAPGRARLLFGLLAALDKPVATGLWTQLIGDARPVTTAIPNPALRHALRVASADLRIGETVMLAMIVLGEDGVAGAGAMAVETVVAALRTVGLRHEARALAREAALAAGI